MFNGERIFVASPGAAKDFLVTEAYKFIKPELQHTLANNIAAEGLLIQEGQVHKLARKNFQSAFHPDRIRQSYMPMWQTTVKMLAALSDHKHSEKNTKPFDRDDGGKHNQLMKLISAASIDIIGKWGFETDLAALKDDHGHYFSRITNAYIKMFKTTKRGQLSLTIAAILGPNLIMSLPLRAAKTIRGVMALVRQAAERIVSEHESCQKRIADMPDKETLPKDDMLWEIMQTNHFSHDELVDQTVHFLAAASETVAGSICWTLHLLSRHQDVQDRSRQEIREKISHDAFQSEEGFRLVDESTFERLPYLESVMKEVLRYHSINTILWRDCIEDAEICGVVIPPGTKLVYSPWATNRDPAHWGSDSRTFNPDRWLDDGSGGADDNHSFLTFGAGPRRCIGELYAKAQMRCIIAGLVGRFKFTPLVKGGSDEGQEIGDNAALTLFKIYETWKIGVEELQGW